MTDLELCHYGVKGQKWGVRRYQYADGTLTPAGKRHRQETPSSKIGLSTKLSDVVKKVKTVATGRQYADTYIKEGTTLSRIQSTTEFGEFAFYATYKKQDSDKYLGLFGKNLKTRAYGDARRAQNEADASGSEADMERAKSLKDKADNMKIYQLKISAMNKLKVPSDENAGDITANLLREKDFLDNLTSSIVDSKAIMRRPQQQILFDQALTALKKDPSRMSTSDKVAVYKAFNLSLTNHNERQVAAQNRFYKEMKKKGYSALLDYNDREYSSYHAKRPMIVFDLDSVRLKAATEADPAAIDRYYRRYTTERVAKETMASTLGVVGRYASRTIYECRAFVDRRTERYLNT